MAQSQPRQNFHIESEAGINRQINMELYASYCYQSMVSANYDMSYCVFKMITLLIIDSTLSSKLSLFISVVYVLNPYAPPLDLGCIHTHTFITRDYL